MLVLAISRICVAQTETEHYKRVQIHSLHEKDYQTIAELGIDLICGAQHKKHETHHHSSLTLELSDSEYQRLKQANIPIRILIEDVSQFYADRNMAALPKAKATLQQAKIASANKQASPYQTLGCTPSSFPVPTNFNLGSMGGMLTYTEVLAELDRMAMLYPNLITTKDLVSDTILTQEGNALYYVKLSDNPNVDETEKEVLYTGLHHAREPMSMMSLIYYMWYLLENYTTDPVVQAIVDNTELYFIPVVNPDGYLYNESTNPMGGGLWRKNRQDNGNNTFGVDLNRNYEMHWGFDNSGSSPFTNNNTYRGPAPFSEAETRTIRDFAYEREFVNVFNNHAYGNLLVHTWSYQPIPCPDEELLDELSEQMTWHNRFNYGNTFSCLNYFANGESSDWFYGEQSLKNKSLAWVPELGSVADGEFWPTPSAIQPQCESYLRLALMASTSAENYGVLNDLTSYQLDSPNEELYFSVQHLSLTAGSFSVQVSSNSPYVTDINTPTMITPSLSATQDAALSTNITLSPTTPAGTIIDFEVVLNNGLNDIYTTTISKMYNPVTVFQDDCSTLNQWTTATWDVVNNTGYSDNTSITDSPTGNSSTGSYTLEMVQALDLSLGNNQVLEFYTKWDIERTFDFVHVQVSTNQSTWTNLCGNYTKAGAGVLDFSPYTSSQPEGEGLYDGLQQSWVREQIDLSAYAGINNLYLRFLIFNDPDNGHGDGFYIDDIRIFREPLGHCEDGIQNFDETGIDCGGVDCIPCPSCTDGIQNGDEQGIDCGGTYCLPCASEQCVAFNFNSFNILSFDAGQDLGTYTILDNGNTLLVENNAWKAIKVDYNITTNTVLAFDFQSTLEGEIHEIELETDLSVGGNARRYKLFGYQNVPLNTNYYYTNSGGYESFVIPIGQHFTGFYPYLVFTVDSDITSEGNSYFRNVTLYEDIDNDLNCDGFTTEFVEVSAKTMLGGVPKTNGKMQDVLRQTGNLPNAEPYTNLGYTHIGGGGFESISTHTFQVSGSNAIVDWVIVELRDKNNENIVIASRSALLQADGDIVDVDGVSNIVFQNITPDDYYVAIRHRNHLGVMTATAIPLNGSSGNGVSGS